MRTRSLIFTVSCLASWLLYLHRYSWGVIKPAFAAENPGLTATELGWLDSAFQAAYGLGQMPIGLAGDVWGPRGVLTGVIFCWSLASAGVAWTTGFWPLCGVRAGFGLAQAGAYPILNKVTRNWFPLEIRTSVQGVVTALGRIGAACSSLILATLLMGVLGLRWQTALYVLVAPGIVLAAACWIVVRDRPEPEPQVPDEKSGTNRRPRLHLNRASLFSLTAMLVYAFVSTFQDQLYVYWIPLFLQEGRGLDAKTMGLFAPLPLVGGAIGGIFGGFLNDWMLRRTGNRRWSRSGIGLTGRCLAAALVLASLKVESGRLAMVVLLIARIFADWSLPSQWGAITDMGGRAAGTVFGLVNTVGTIGGFAAGPILGYLKQHYGWDGLFHGVVAMLLASALTWLFIDCTQKLVSD